jgi:hypothetical protein
LGATPPAWHFGDRLLEEVPRSTQVAGALLKGCSFEQARPVLRAFRWAGPKGGRRELGGHTGPATLARPDHRIVERTRHNFVRAGCRSSKVSGPVLDVARVSCQFGMNRTTLARPRRCVYGRREHRVGVAHSIAGSLDEAVFDREGEGLVGKVGTVASGRQVQKLSLRPCRQALDARENGVGKSRRNAHRVGDLAVLAPTCDAFARNLERIERMAGGEVCDSLDVVTAKAPVRRLDDEFPNRLVRQRSH